MMNELTKWHRTRAKQAVLHLQATTDEMGNPIWYAEALIQGDKPDQRCALRGPMGIQESESLQLFLAELAKVIMERTTFIDHG